MDNENVKIEIDKYEAELAKAIDFLASTLDTVRAGRASKTVMDRIYADFYGTMTPISQMANVTNADARTLLITLWDPSTLKEVIKAINNSDLGINPIDDGKNIRLVYPQLTEERRKELTKQVRKYAEDSKVTLRNLRRDVLDKIKKMKKDGLSEDETAEAERTVQKILDRSIEKVDKMLKEKENDIIKI